MSELPALWEIALMEQEEEDLNIAREISRLYEANADHLPWHDAQEEER